MTDIEVDAQNMPEEKEQPEGSLNLKQLSVVLPGKIEKTIVRLNSLDVDLADDIPAFTKYVTEFAIDFALRKKYGDMDDDNANIEQFLKITPDSEFYVEALEIMNALFDEATHCDYGASDEESNREAEEFVLANDDESFFYDANDRTKVHIPPIWTPKLKRTNAAFVYLFFRQVL